MLARFAALGPLILSAVLFTACDAFVEFTVVNHTGGEVTVWLLYDECSTVVGEFGQYDYETVLASNEEEVIFDAVGSEPPEPSCVQAVDSQRRLIFSEPYIYGNTYAVEARSPGPYVPTEGDLPKSFLDRFNDLPTLVQLPTLWTPILLLGVAAFMIIRFLRRRGRRRNEGA